MNKLQQSWNAFTSEQAEAYLVSSGSPSPNSQRMLVDIIKECLPAGSGSVIDLGCGNANLFHPLVEAIPGIDYTGVDFSGPLVSAANASIADRRAHIVQADVNSLAGVEGMFDLAVYSHTIEMLGSPERSLMAASKIAGKIVIRFFEPPEFAEDEVEIREMPAGENVVPYLRRKMGRDYYHLILAKIGCTAVDVYRDEWAKDQIHVLHY